jgi:DNA-binding NtrC family response regulator
VLESIKGKLWEVLQGKEVSLAMLYNSKGEILWHRGRPVQGRTVQQGEGFAKSHIQASFKAKKRVEGENLVIAMGTENLTRSAEVLRIKSLVILPVSGSYFLYIDSGGKESFSDADREVFKIIGELLDETINQVRRSSGDVGGVTGSSPEMTGIRELVLSYSLEEEPVLLLGETGVGKSRIAEMIHRYSGRKGKFVTVNTPGIPDNLFESEVFGHKQGAFTDARSDKRGYVDEARGGTLFFDEISEIPVSFQSRLLRFIETRKYQILGEPVERDADVRIITASNRNLQEAMRSKAFREDLFFRLQVLEIEIPPLRDRPEDIRALVQDNWGLLRGKRVAAGFWEALMAYTWPGNIRELVTVLTRAGISSAEPVGGQEVQDIIGNARHGESPETGALSMMRETLQRGESFWEAVWRPFIKRDLSRHEVRQFLKTEYAACDFSLKKLSQRLNIQESERKKFVALLHKYNIHPVEKRQ